MIHFMKWKWLYFLISAIFLVPGIISLLLFGLRPSIDFTGGTELQVALRAKEGQSVSEQSVRDAVGDSFEINEIHLQGNLVTILAKPVDLDKKTEVMEKLKQKFLDAEEKSFESIGPTLGRELILKTLVAILLSAGGITLYVAYRFSDLKYGVCAVLAMFHDTFILLGAFSILGKLFGVQVDTLFVTAMLTILSFSVHDTIVVYDRIRELRKKSLNVTYEEIVDIAVTETMSRSINNSMSIIFMLFVLWLLGGESLRWFSLALLIGTVTGTYSSTFTAAPLLVLWSEIQAKWRKK